MNRKIWILFTTLFAACLTLAGGGVATAQSGLNTTNYGYFASDGTAIMMSVVTSTVPGMAAELVSPQYADDFFAGFTPLTNQQFAQNLSAAQIAQVSQADEYMVFEGSLDWTEGELPGYVIFLSTNDNLFLVVGYEKDADAVFGLAEQAIQQGVAPAQYGDFVRLAVDELGDLDESSGGSSSSSSSYGSTDYGNVFCNVDPGVSFADLNGDTYITTEELASFVGLIDGSELLLETMEENGFDSIQYVNC